MKELFERWVETDETPSDYYQLLGQPRLSPDRQTLLHAVRSATRILQLYQNHQSEQIVSRARSVQILVAEAKRTFSHDSAWHAYDQSLTSQLRQQYAERAGSDPSLWRPENLRRWLELLQHVHPSCLDNLIAKFIPNVGGKPTAKGPAELAELQDPGKLQASVTPPGQKPSQRKPDQPAFVQLTPVDTSPVVSPGCAGSAQSLQPDRVTRVAAGTPPSDVPTASSQPRPKPPTFLPRGSRSSRGGPPQHFPPAEYSAHSGCIPAGSAPLPPAISTTDAEVEKWSHSDLLWIVGSAVVSALVLGLICVVFLLPRLIAFRTSPPSRIGQSQSSKTLAGGNRSSWSSGQPRSGVSQPAGSSSEPTAPSSLPEASEQPQAEDTTEESARSSRARSPVRPSTSESPLADKPNTSSTLPPEKPPTSREADNLTPIDLPHDRPVLTLAWSSDGSKLATAGDDSVVYVWNASNGRRLLSLDGHTAPVRTLDWNDSGDYLASGGDDGTIRVWSIRDGTLYKKLGNEDSSPITAVAWLGKDKPLLLGDGRGDLSMWNPRAGTTRQGIHSGTGLGAVRALRRRGLDGAMVLYVDGSILLWNVNDKVPLRMILSVESTLWSEFTGESPPDIFRRTVVTPHNHGNFRDLALRADAPALAVANGDVDIWNISAIKVNIRAHLLVGRPEEKGYRTVAWRQDGKLLAAGDDTGELSVWEATHWKILFTDKQPSSVSLVAWCPPDGKRLAVACENGHVRILPIGCNPSSQPLEPPFTVADALARAEQFLRDGDWPQLARAVSLLNMPRLTTADNEKLRKLRFEVTRAAKVELEDLERRPGDDRAEDFVFAVQEMIDLDPTGLVLEKGRKLLEKVDLRQTARVRTSPPEAGRRPVVPSSRRAPSPFPFRPGSTPPRRSHLP